MKSSRFIYWSVAVSVVVGAVLLRVRDVTPQGSWINQIAYTPLRPALSLLDLIASQSQRISFITFFPISISYCALLGLLVALLGLLVGLALSFFRPRRGVKGI